MFFQKVIMKNNFCDVVIVGGGVMVAQSPTTVESRTNLKVMLLSKIHLTSMLPPSVRGGCESSIQSQENILISLYTVEVLKHFEEEMAIEGEKPDIGFRQKDISF